jgi:DNA-binding YbaB/EbfC family protein
MLQGITNLMSLLQNAQQVGTRIQAVRDELKGKRVVGSAGGGMVEVEVNGLCEVLRVKIDPVLLQGQEHEMVEDLLPAAINQAFNKAKELHLDLAKSATKDISFPGLEEALSRLAQ